MADIRSLLEGPMHKVPVGRRERRSALVLEAATRVGELISAEHMSARGASHRACKEVAARYLSGSGIDADTLNMKQFIDQVRLKVNRARKAAGGSTDMVVKMHGNRVVTNEDEQRVVAVILALNRISSPPTLPFMIKWATKNFQLAAKRGGDGAGDAEAAAGRMTDSSMRRLLHRHLDVIGMRHGMPIASVRPACAQEHALPADRLEQWLHAVADCPVLSQLMNIASCKVCVEEVQLQVRAAGDQWTVRQAALLEEPAVDAEDADADAVPVTMLPFVGADRTVHLVVYVVPEDGEHVSEHACSALVPLEDDAAGDPFHPRYGQADAHTLAALDASSLAHATAVRNERLAATEAEPHAPAGVQQTLPRAEPSEAQTSASAAGDSGAGAEAHSDALPASTGCRRFVAFTRGGRVNLALLNLACWQFQRLWNQEGDVQRGACALLLGGVASLATPDLYSALLQRDVFPIPLPFAASSRLHPLGEHSFSALRASVAVNHPGVDAPARSARGADEWKGAAALAAVAAEAHWAAPQNLRGAWERAGLEPYHLAQMRRVLRVENGGDPSPAHDPPPLALPTLGMEQGVDGAGGSDATGTVQPPIRPMDAPISHARGSELPPMPVAWASGAPVSLAHQPPVPASASASAPAPAPAPAPAAPPRPASGRARAGSSRSAAPVRAIGRVDNRPPHPREEAATSRARGDAETTRARVPPPRALAPNNVTPSPRWSASAMTPSQMAASLLLATAEAADLDKEEGGARRMRQGARAGHDEAGNAARERKEEPRERSLSQRTASQVDECSGGERKKRAEAPSRSPQEMDVEGNSAHGNASGSQRSGPPAPAPLAPLSGVAVAAGRQTEPATAIAALGKRRRGDDAGPQHTSSSLLPRSRGGVDAAQLPENGQVANGQPAADARSQRKRRKV